MKVMVLPRQMVVKNVTMEIMLVGMVVHLLALLKMNMSALMQMVIKDGGQVLALLSAVMV
jgi:hypothetical protein